MNHHPYPPYNSIGFFGKSPPIHLSTSSIEIKEGSSYDPQ